MDLCGDKAKRKRKKRTCRSVTKSFDSVRLRVVSMITFVETFVIRRTNARYNLRC